MFILPIEAKLNVQKVDKAVVVCELQDLLELFSLYRSILNFIFILLKKLTVLENLIKSRILIHIANKSSEDDIICCARLSGLLLFLEISSVWAAPGSKELPREQTMKPIYSLHFI